MRRTLAISWVLLIVVLGAACSPVRTAPLPAPTQSPLVSATALSGVDPDSGLPLVALSDLPPEAVETVTLIENGGPYPYSQDGAVFQNREGILPDQPQGYYHEYTVETPGSDDRGARRIVAGGFGAAELYWSDDHYASFERISR